METRDYPVVVKADGLAAGKGVIVCQDTAEALRAIERIMVREEFGARAGRRVVLRLLGEAHACLRPGGRLYLVARTQQGARTLGRLMGETYAQVHEVARGGGFRVFEGSHV